MHSSTVGWTIVMLPLSCFQKKTVRTLQLLHKAATRVLTITKTTEHITPVLKSLNLSIGYLQNRF